MQNTIIYNHKNPSNNTTSTAAPFSHLPQLTDNEHTLLMDNHRCLKCRCLFEYHVSKDCTNDWPNTSTYCTITTEVTMASRAGKIRMNVAVAMTSVSNPITSSTMVAIVSPNPVTYVAVNMQSVIADDANYSDSDDSSSLSCAVVVSRTEIPTSTVKQIREKVGPAPFFEPHLWWHCSTDVSDFILQTINALIDPGSHTVLICMDLVDTLLLIVISLGKTKFLYRVSDWRTRSDLSFEPTWETVRPVAFDSLQLKAAEWNYPVHEKDC